MILFTIGTWDMEPTKPAAAKDSPHATAGFVITHYYVVSYIYSTIYSTFGSFATALAISSSVGI